MTSSAGPPPDPVYVFNGFNDGVSAVSFVDLNNKHFLLTGDSSGEIALWDLSTMKSLWRRQCVREGEESRMKHSIISCGSWSRGIWAHSRGRCVQFWTVEAEKYEPVEICTLPCTFLGFCAASVSTTRSPPTYDLVAIPVENNGNYSIHIYRLNEEGAARFAVGDVEKTSDPNPLGSPVSCVLTETQSISPDLHWLLIVGFESGTAQAWLVSETAASRAPAEKMVQETILCLDFMPNRRFGVCVSPEVINCWSIVDDKSENAGMRIMKRGDIQLPTAGAGVVRIRRDGKIFASGGWDGKIRVFSVKTLAPLAVLQFHTKSVRCLCFSDGAIGGRRLMAAGSSDGSMSLWTLYSS